MMNSNYDFSICGLCQHLIGPPPSPIFSLLPWQFTFVHPLLGHTWTFKHSSRIVRRLVAHKVPLDFARIGAPLSGSSAFIPYKRNLYYAPLVPDNSNDNNVAYSSRVPASASSCPELRYPDPIFASAS
ncbi:hypothetical protein B296_00020628 [Ensete ventricosum]|uniref:Uncharacterized protein n=1 Tax=Ensete ventricosum TaxID=4639 RepID=A0A426XCE3_ENSVE|nr:hypothetical protein B296_00020628 [Ensete ventricosum]